MKTILLTAAFYLVLSAAVTAVIGFVSGVPLPRLPVEVMRQPRTSFTDEAMHVILDSPAFRQAAIPQMIILGASGAQEAWRPADLQPKVPSFQVSNLALGAANVSEVRQALDYSLKFLPAEVRGQSVLVLGLSYPLFVPDEVRWRHPAFVSPSIVAAGIYISDIQREAMRSPWCCDSNHPLFRMLPVGLHEAAMRRAAVWYQLSAALPVNPGEWLVKPKEWRWRLPDSLVGDSGRFAAPVPAPLTEFTPRHQMHWLTDYMGGGEAGLQPGQFLQLKALLDRADRAGMRVIVADMPLPSWHRNESPYHAPYRQLLHQVLASRSGAQAVIFADLSQSISDEDFRDSIHPTEQSKERWIQVLAKHLEKLAGP